MPPSDSSLPIFEIQPELVSALNSENVRIVVEAPTGSGKSTQVPAMLLDSGKCDGEIYVLQPRRLAARMLARRVAQERGSRCGEEIGYQVRFENVVSRDTRIRYVTEGILLRRLLEDPNLAGVSAVVFDEFHERHFFGDVTLARCLGVQQLRRPDLKLVAMSATLETESLVNYLGEGTQHLKSEGRTFPVEIEYVPAKERHSDQLWDHVIRAMAAFYKANGTGGHALIFMPGRHEIRKTVSALRNTKWAKDFEIHELFGEASPNAQDAAVSKSARPKIVVATNVAETSITIDGVTLVVDSGLERRSSFDSRRGISTLTIEKISRASADQRAGRAGRTRAGTCLRLWSERDHETRAEATPAEIQRMDLSEAVLVLKAGGIDDVRGFNWFESPNPQGLETAFSWLKTLGALDPDDEMLTPTGMAMSKVPLTPRFARVLLAAADAGCLEYFAIIAAAAQGRPLFPNQKRRGSDLSLSDFREPGDRSDFQALVRAWNAAASSNFNRDACDRLGIMANAARDIARMSDQFVKTVWRLSRREDQNLEPDSELIARILLTGFSDRVAMRNSAGTLACSVVGGRRGQLEKYSIVADSKAGSRLFIAGEMIEIEGRDLNVKLNLATCLDEHWLAEHFPNDFVEKAAAVYNESNRRVEAREERRFRDLVLESRAKGEPPRDEAAELLAREVLAGNLNLKRWDQAIEQEIGRINTVAAAFPEYQIPSIGEEERLLLLIQICEGGFSYKDIKDRHVKPALAEWLPPSQYHLLDQFAPERIELSSGRNVKIFYDPDSAVKPKISVMIQHLFPVKETPRIADGRVPLVIEILAPNQRPVQVTEDLAGFWRGSYAGVRAQLRGRYPKHDWPEPESYA